MTKLKNKKILLIMPFFYRYEEAIRKHLAEAGAEVFLVDTNLHAHGTVQKLIMFGTKRLRDRLVMQYYAAALREVPPQLDEVLVIKGQWMTDALLERLRTRFPSAVFRIYQWDSVATFPDQLRLHPHFDRIYTFDPVDAAQYGWHYRPLFFDRALCHADEEKRCDLVFICSMHTKRMQVLRQLRELAEKRGKMLYSYVYVPPFQYFRDAVLRRDPLYRGVPGALHFRSLPQAATFSVYAGARCVVDYTFPQQNGLSMRTCDALGCRCKLVTNNAHVREADFYDPQNIYIYDPAHLEIPENFLESPYRELPPEIYARYELDGFLEELLS